MTRFRPQRGSRRRFAVLLALLPLAARTAAAGPPSVDEAESQAAPDVTRMSLEELAAAEVTSVSRRPEARFTAGAPIAVITADEIRALGLTSLPEILRLVPGVLVARINSNQWAVGVRGFASRLSRSLLVLIDGRSVYSPLFTGVYWEDLLLDEIDRIEIIRGPGGALWGANAVNGVVNVVTRRAAASQGGMLITRAGNDERFKAGVRYGGRIGNQGFYRFYAKYFDRAAQVHPDDDDFDAWRQGQAAFRADWEKSDSNLTLDSALYLARNGQRTTYGVYQPPFSVTVEQKAHVSAGHLLARYDRSLASGRFTGQLYYDRTGREEANFNEDRDTFDLELQHHLVRHGRHELVVGSGYRASHSSTGGVETVIFRPSERTEDLISGFINDAVALVPDRLSLSLGARLERNDYSGLEVHPSAALSWTPTLRRTIWTSLARTVRTPSPVDNDIDLTLNAVPGQPTFFRVLGSHAFAPEELIAWQAGWREHIRERVLLDLAVFHHHHDRLLSIEPGTPFAEDGRTILPFTFANRLEGRGRGAELAIDLRLAPTCWISGSYSYLDLDLQVDPDSLDTLSEQTEHSAPRHQGNVRGSLLFAREWSLSAFLRVVGELESQAVPAYAELDLRLAWQPRRTLLLSVAGKNLLHPDHLEFAGNSPDATRIRRAVLGEAVVRW